MRALRIKTIKLVLKVSESSPSQMSVDYLSIHGSRRCCGGFEVEVRLKSDTQKVGERDVGSTPLKIV